jgi:hypothetical protein
MPFAIHDSDIDPGLPMPVRTVSSIGSYETFDQLIPIRAHLRHILNALSHTARSAQKCGRR